MTVVVDTSILIDVLRGELAAAAVLRKARASGPLQASEVTRLEVLAGMRPREEDATRALFAAFTWHSMDGRIAEIAGELGRQWLPGNRGIDSADLAIAATAVALDAGLLTRNVKHFPMFSGLSAPY
ncbi:type II toxin-antitoxin system VapC family toxin [Microbacterium elymi]|uniref:Ribonuclease VapC n=1 Tax=Microbacterium elymi TaxID=2909587 RepID=A0ABY5NKT6_9MICO|nr:type II toxin-antitoxin system VapC family toxin [Microbacterium elymi]UUT35729.1 type II toxin-antitoxin system VapC family toxin [Microbacterium elymi]